jgi:uncharacterized protein (TIGR02271 family)
MAMRAGKRANEDPESRGPMRKAKPAVIPVIQEQATVQKRVVETGRVRIAKHVREYEEIVDVPHFQEEVKVERVPVNQFVDAVPEVRTEGETTIIPVVEERYVVEKRLFVVEELHVRKERHETHNPQKVRVLKEEVEVERLSPGEAQLRDQQRQTTARGRTRQPGR